MFLRLKDTHPTSCDYFGKKFRVRVIFKTPQVIAETLLIKKHVANLVYSKQDETIAVIGITNLVFDEKGIRSTNYPLFRLDSLGYRATTLIVGITLNSSLKGHCPDTTDDDLELHPIYQVRSDVLKSIDDIESLLGFQLIHKRNKQHLNLKRIDTSE